MDSDTDKMLAQADKLNRCQYNYLTLMQSLKHEPSVTHSIGYITAFNRVVPGCIEASSGKVDPKVITLLKDAVSELNVYINDQALNRIDDTGYIREADQRRVVQAYVHSRNWHRYALYRAMDTRTKVIYHRKQIEIGGVVLSMMWLLRRVFTG